MVNFKVTVGHMEVYTAARDGNTDTLRQVLDPQSKDEVLKLIQTKADTGATPLIIAAKNGHIKTVELLVDKYGADIEMVGAVTFDGENIEGAPPLWCAAAAGHVDVVKYLVKSGAGVNKTTFTNSTPLRAACFDGHYAIMKYLVESRADIEVANRHGHTCLMISCYKGHYSIVKYLIAKGADVNRKSLKGNTALHDCAESGSLVIMKLLLMEEALMEKDSYGMTPLLAAAVTGHTEIVKYLVLREDCFRLERAEALELLGATYVDKKRNIAGAVKYWRLALTERCAAEKSYLNGTLNLSPVVAYGNAKEIQTVEELEIIALDPDAMRMQALLVRERILGPAHPDTSYYIRYRGAVYADIGDFDRCVLLWMYALDMQQKILEPLCPMTQSSFLSFAELFSFMMTDGRNRKAHPVSFLNMISIYKKAFIELESGLKHFRSGDGSDKDQQSLNRLLTIILHLTSLFCKIESSLSIDEVHQFKKMVYQLIKMNPRGLNRYTLLHLACSRNTTTVGRYPVCSFPSLDVIRLLLEMGASVTAIDTEGNTPLHVAAFNVPCNIDIITLLLQFGGHHDACNNERRTPLPLIAGDNISDINSPLRHMTLQCLSARCIIDNSIPYEHHIPQKLFNFVKMH